jgi:hypothetical protein
MLAMWAMGGRVVVVAVWMVVGECWRFVGDGRCAHRPMHVSGGVDGGQWLVFVDVFVVWDRVGSWCGEAGRWCGLGSGRGGRVGTVGWAGAVRQCFVGVRQVVGGGGLCVWCVAVWSSLFLGA